MSFKKLIPVYELDDTCVDEFLEKLDETGLYKLNCVFDSDIKERFSYGFKYAKVEDEERDVAVFYDDEYVCCAEWLWQKYGYIDACDCNPYRQCLVRRVDAEKNEVKITKLVKQQTGYQCFKSIKKMLLEDYTEEEIEEVFYAHEADYDEDLIQQHITVSLVKNKRVVYKNCYKYDINAAHTDALLELFPKSRERILYMYEHRHDDNDYYKKCLNYYVGYLCKAGHRKTYNWIVQRTTKKMLAAEAFMDGFIIYANTDGFAIQNPKRIFESSKEIGEFELESQGTMYYYTGENYFVFQYPTEDGYDLRGTAPKKYRKMIDIKKHKAIKYNTEVKNGRRQIKNLKEIRV